MSTSVRGVVLRGTGGVWDVLGEDGQRRNVSLPGRLKKDAAMKLVVGDDVRVARDERDRAWTVAEILPRRSTLSRRAPGGAYAERVVAANLDQVVVVFAAAEPDPHPRMLDRFLVIAAANEIPARIVINKIDLRAEQDAPARFGVYERAGYALHYTSVPRRAGLQALRAVLRDRVSALTGPSGVGKSSLLNAIYPGLDLRVGEISRSVLKGRHTTVGAEMHPLPEGGYVMDTPGLREVGVWGIASGELDRCFLELRPYIPQCRFGDCRHVAEPGCAVREAVAHDAISPARYESYTRLLDELEQAARPW